MARVISGEPRGNEMRTRDTLKNKLQARLQLVVGMLAVIFSLSAAACWAPDANGGEPATAESVEPVAASESPDTAADDALPPYPAGLDDPAIDLAELQLRLIPLTVDQLSALADAWQGNVAGQTQAVIEQTLLVSELPEEHREAGRERVVELTESRDDGFDRFTAVVSNLARKGGDEAAIATYRAYRASIIVQEKQQADWQTLLKGAMAWIVSPEGGVQLATRFLIIGAALLGLLIVAKVVRGYAGRVFERVPNISKLLQGFLAMVAYWITIAVGLMIVLSALGVDVTPLFALFGGGAFILAFAMQETLGNLAAGLMIMINRPFDEGDYVDVGGVAGTVKSVSIVATTVTTPDNQVIVIPNKNVWGNVITNVTASETRRVDLVFGIGYDDSIPDSLRVMEETVRAHPFAPLHG